MNKDIMDGNYIRLTRRSWFARLAAVPKLAAYHYQIIRRYNGRLVSAHTAISLALQILR